MGQNRIITLLTDFGLTDPYAGILKGIIAGIAPDARVIDLTHGIPPQDLEMASFCLASAFPYFPEGTVHVAVVDPGVGTTRRPVAIQTRGGCLVGPDNGLFTGVLDRHASMGAVELCNREYWLTPEPSSTFQGRDIFAPVGAHLSLGVPMRELGTEIDIAGITRIAQPLCAINGLEVSGCIQHADHFGNLVTNVAGDLVAGRAWRVLAGGLEIPGLSTYGDAPPGSLLALVGSHGCVEISANGGSALAHLRLPRGAPVRVLRTEQ